MPIRAHIAGLFATPYPPSFSIVKYPVVTLSWLLTVITVIPLVVDVEHLASP